jgi:single-stranded-DNA-specific exonuclease
LTTTPHIATRDVPPRTVFTLEQGGVHPLLARLFAARGVRSTDELDDALAKLLPPTALKGATEAAVLLADAIAAGDRICVVADYDCDGATACAVALRGLAMLGAAPETLHYVVPDRAVHGYGLTPTIVDLAVQLHQPQLLLTVDNGIASLAGVAHAKALGLKMLVTDHHLPALVDDEVQLPAADVIVNPSQPGCGFPSKALAGVGVMFYVLLALRAELRQRGHFDAKASPGRSQDDLPAPGGGMAHGGVPGGPAPQPKLDGLLDLVALGTVADVVKLDGNNRRLVAQGLRRIRAGRMQPGVAALFTAASRQPARASAFDFGFALGPRINAAGRLSDMTLGIECLLTDSPQRATELASQLDAINRERREVEAGTDGLLKGSGRSIPGFHLRDALDLVTKRHPGVLKKFGGHAMAAGCTLAEEDFDTFDAALQQVAAEWLQPEALTRTVATDGPLPVEYFNPETVAKLDAVVWGQGFEAPVFCDLVDVVQQRLVGEKHLKLRVRHGGPQGTLRDAIWFGHAEPVAERLRLAYRLSLDEFQGQQRVQMVVEAAL